MIDDRGRLFGKVNVIDAAVIALLLLLVPIAYGAYALFRVPPPQIIKIEPDRLIQGENLSIQVHAAYLRPFLRAVIGIDPALGFLIESPNLGEVKLPNLPPGTYDLILYDEAREVARRPNILTILPRAAPPAPPSFVVQVLGKFTGLEQTGVRSLAVGSQWAAHAGGPDVAEVLALEPTQPAMQGVRINPTIVIPTSLPGKVQVPAILRLRCALVSDVCKIGDAPVARDVQLSLFRGTENVGFIVDEVRSADAPAAFPSAIVQVRGKFAEMSAAVGGTIKAGARFPDGAASPVAEVLAVQTAEPATQRVRVGGNVTTTPIAGKVQVPAILRLRCALAAEGCKVGDTVTVPDAVLSLPRGRGDAVKFLVEEVRSSEAPMAFPFGRTATAELTVRFVVRPEVFSLVKVGDKALGSEPSLGGKPRETAELLTLGQAQTLRSLVSIELDPNPNRTHQVEQQVTSFDSIVRAQAQETPAGWQSNNQVIKIGATFSFETPLYVMRGWIVKIVFPSARAD